MEVPALGSEQVLAMLAGADARSVLLGVLAAEALGVGEERRAYQGAVVRLTGHPDPAVAQAAQRVARAWREGVRRRVKGGRGRDTPLP